MTTLNTVQKFALADTYIAKENVRAETVHDADGIALLAGSIRHFGRLLEPLKAYIDADGRAAVWDGGRRWTALKHIEADADGVGAVIIEAIDVFVTSQDDASAASLATFVREDQHPADQFLAYNAKFDEGMSAEQIAAAFAVESRDVAKLLRFRTLSPRVLEAFRAARFGLDVAYAFTLTTDHDKQHALLDAQPEDREFRAQTVKSALSANAVTARDKWARYIGREAYEAAGGTFIQDLFSQHQADEQWSDGDLVKELAEGKLRALEESLKAEGWSKMIVPQYAYGWQDGYVQMKAEGPTKKGQARAFTADQMARGVVFVVFDYSGEVEIKKGYEKAAKPAIPPSKAKADPETFGWGHNGHHIMTQVANDMTKVAIAANPAAAADALLIQLAWSVLRKPTYGTVAHDMASSMVPDARTTSRPEHTTVQGLFEMNCDLKAWSDQLPKQPVAFYDAVAALPADEKLRLQAICYASTLDAVETKYDARRPNAWRHLGWLARHAGVAPDTMADSWSPDGDFLKGGSKDALLAVVEKVKPKGLVHAKGWPNAKKGELVDVADRYVGDQRWLPKLLAEFTDVKDPEPKPKPTLSADAPADDDDGADAASQDEYLGWIATSLVNDHDMQVEAAKAIAEKALAFELADVQGGFGDASYNWGRSDAYASATSYLEAHDLDAAED